jgi:deoxyribodipyrimidine photo-lyase
MADTARRLRGTYIRMLWGKKILECAAAAGSAHVMPALNNMSPLDGRDPTSYSGVFWVARPLRPTVGPERPVFGTVRYMSSANTARKVRVREHIRRYAP